MTLRPKVQADGRPVKLLSKMADSFEAVTHYHVLSESSGAALVECTPETGVSYVCEMLSALCLCIQMVGE